MATGEGIITSVEQQKKQRQRYNVFIDEQFAFAVHEDVLVRHRLFKGQIVSPGQLEEVLKDEERQQAYLQAIRWLGLRPRTEREIRMYLGRKEYEPSVIDVCLEQLASQGYVDDDRFSHALAEERLQRHGKGKQWIKHELLQKGVDKRTVEEAVGAIGSEEEKDACAALAAKRWPALARSGDRNAAKRKLYAYLARRGFSAEAAREAVRRAEAVHSHSDNPASARDDAQAKRAGIRSFEDDSDVFEGGEWE